MWTPLSAEWNSGDITQITLDTSTQYPSINAIGSINYDLRFTTISKYSRVQTAGITDNWLLTYYSACYNSVTSLTTAQADYTYILAFAATQV